MTDFTDMTDAELDALLGLDDEDDTDEDIAADAAAVLAESKALRIAHINRRDAVYFCRRP